MEAEGASHQVKKVVLPSGKTIEVGLFPEREEETRHLPAEPEQDLSVCVACTCRADAILPEDFYA